MIQTEREFIITTLAFEFLMRRGKGVAGVLCPNHKMRTNLIREISREFTNEGHYGRLDYDLRDNTLTINDRHIIFLLPEQRRMCGLRLDEGWIYGWDVPMKAIGYFKLRVRPRSD